MKISYSDRCPPENRKHVLIVAILASAMGFIDGSVVAVALPQIRSALGADFAAAQWISNSYLLFLGSLILLGGALGDYLGIKRVFSWGVMLFTFASIACALVPTAESLIVARAVQGTGAAIMLPGSMALISYNTPREERGRAMGIWIAASAITTSMGPMVGGLVLTYGGEFSWRLIFAINVPFGLLTLFLLARKVPEDTPQKAMTLSQLDWTGALLMTASLALLAAGLTFAGEVGRDVLTMVLLLAGLIVGGITIWWERRVENPMVDVNLFRSRQFSMVNILTFLVWSGMGAVTFFLPMVLIVGWKLPATYAGGMFLAFGMVVAICSPISGRLTDAIGTRIMLTVGPLVIGLAFLILAWATIGHSYWYGVIPALLTLGLGIGLTGSPVSTAVVNSVSDAHTGAASGINNMVARLANLFAVAGLGVFVSFVYSAIIFGSDLPPEIQQSLAQLGFGERLTGGLYQIATVELQVIAMDHAIIALCLVLATMSFIGALFGWFAHGRD